MAGDWTTPNPTYLLRVQAAQIENPDAYEVFSGTPASPAWSANMADRQPIFVSPTGSSFNGSLKTTITYIPPLATFILTYPLADDMSKWTIRRAPKPWGPWTEIATYNVWCWSSGALTEVLMRHVAPK